MSGVECNSGNWLLASLSPADRKTLSICGRRVPLIRGKLLFEHGNQLSHVYLVESGVVSVRAAFVSGGSHEMAIIGREGMVGICNLLGSGAAVGHYRVQASGTAWAIRVDDFANVLESVPTFRKVCQSYARAFAGQLLQIAACNSVHDLKKRFIRWLLMCHDRSDNDTLVLKQDYLATILGVCRSSLTVAACRLQDAGLICYTRGNLTITNRSGLEGEVCECYGIASSFFDVLHPRQFNQPNSRRSWINLDNALTPVRA